MSSTADWFARKMANTNPPPAQPIQLPAQPSALPPISQQFSQPYTPQPQPVSKAQSAQQTASCPTCYSDNYMSVNGAAPRCFDCGYPLEQSGSRYGSLTGAKVEGSAKPSVGNDTQSNWNPQGIIGRVG